MLNQNFSSRNFLRLLKRQDIFQYELGNSIADYVVKFDAAVALIEKEDFHFSPFRKYSLSHGDVISPSCLADEFALRKLNDNIKRVFNIGVIDRNRIIPQVKVLLAETGEYWVQKLDIRKFFESIDRDEIQKIVCNDPRLSYESKRILGKLFACPEVMLTSGLRRGISLSSTLSELYMQKFDTNCRMMDGSYFYTRYVDDIIIVFHEKPENILNELGKQLPPGLSFNEEKCAFIHHPKKGPVVVSDGKQCITYLGYEFNYLSDGPQKSSRLEVGVAPKKIQKIKTRIALALFDFCKTKNYDLLKNRLKFLSSNYRIGEDSGSGKLYAGIHFNHSLIDASRLSDLKEIDNFVRKAIFSRKGSLGRGLAPLLNMDQRRELCQLSLFHGYKKKIVRPFARSEFREIKAVWNHV